jgi:hypothetical protein
MHLAHVHILSFATESPEDVHVMEIWFTLWVATLAKYVQEDNVALQGTARTGLTVIILHSTVGTDVIVGYP